MSAPHWVLLPGMHGNSRLFAEISPHLPGGNQSHIGYPDRPLGYSELLPIVRSELPEEPFVLLAESFSGPLGIQIAAQPPPQMLGLVLVATFATCPHPALYAPSIAMGAAFSLPPPRVGIRRWMVGPDASDALVDSVLDALGQTSATTLVSRAIAMRQIDVLNPLSAIRLPVTYLAASDDRLVSPRSLQQMREALPSLDHTVIDGPHLLLQSRIPEAVAALEAFSTYQLP